MKEKKRGKDQSKKTVDFKTTFLDTEREIAIIDYELAIKDWEAFRERNKDNLPKKD